MTGDPDSDTDAESDHEPEPGDDADGDGASPGEPGERTDRVGGRRGDVESDRPALADRRGVERVYGPAEDSTLLAEAAIEVVDTGDTVLDVGTGSGYVADRVREATGARVVASDVNPHACQRAHATGLVVRGDLTVPFPADSFDVVMFNPPYLPIDPANGWDDWMETAISGGPEGRETVDRFLADVGRVLVPGGTALLLVSTLTDPEAVRRTAAGHALDSETVATASYPFERLLVLALSDG